MAPPALTQKAVTAVTSTVPALATGSRMGQVIKTVAVDPQLNEGVKAMMERASEFESPITAMFAGIAMVPEARKQWEAMLDEEWAKTTIPNNRSSYVHPEVIIGGGLQAAIYCMIRARLGKQAPLVLEQRQRVGGVFALSKKASFFLNSRNRPGRLSIPGSSGSLNVLPGAILQPADISTEEYMVNSDLAYVIRTTLAASGAKIITGANVAQLNVSSAAQKASDKKNLEINLVDGCTISARRVLVSTGVGQPLRQWPNETGRLLSFEQFMQKMDEPFPLKGMEKVAVIGAGDSGKVAVEALTGQGPSRHWSVPSLDWLQRIDWYGQPNVECDTFLANNRSRYARIGPLLSNSRGSGRRARRVFATANKVTYVENGYDTIIVDGIPYDMAIDCTGYDGSSLPNLQADQYSIFSPEGNTLGRMFSSGYEGYIIGPAAALARSEPEALATPDTREGKVAMWRYAGKTARLAQVLD